MFGCQRDNEERNSEERNKREERYKKNLVESLYGLDE
jgi:hypothetical protein